MKEPGLDGRHRNADGEIHKKRSDAQNQNLSSPIPGFGPKVTVGQMRAATDEESLAGIRNALKNSKPKTK